MLKAFDENSRPLVERVADRIGELIITNDIQWGEKLPNEFELAESLNVGRRTIREAVKLLVSRNISNAGNLVSTRVKRSSKSLYAERIVPNRYFVNGRKSSQPSCHPVWD